MRVGFVTSRFPYPPDRGDRLTLLNLLRTFKAAGHDLTLVAFTDGSEPAEGMAEVARYCDRIETVRLPRLRSWVQAWLGLFSLRPSQVTFYHSLTMRARVLRELAPDRCDAVFVHMIRMAPYGIALGHPNQVVFIGDSFGMGLERSMRFAPWWKRPGLAWERWRVDRFTAGLSRHFRESWALSPVDAADLRRIGCERVVLVPHGVDERLFDIVRRPEARPLVMSLGNLSVPHNVDAARYAAEEIWPIVRAARPDARLVLAGADPVPAVQRLAALEGVEVPGHVPDLRGLWAGAHVLLAPLRYSTGIQNKVLEAMAAGVPVVTTTPVAAAIGAVGGEHLLTAEDAAGLARAVVAVLDDPEAARRRATSGLALVRRDFSWTTAVTRVEALVHRAG